MQPIYRTTPVVSKKSFEKHPTLIGPFRYLLWIITKSPSSNYSREYHSLPLSWSTLRMLSFSSIWLYNILFFFRFKWFNSVFLYPLRRCRLVFFQNFLYYHRYIQMEYSNLLQNYGIKTFRKKIYYNKQKNNLFCHFFLNYCNFLKFI